MHSFSRLIVLLYSNVDESFLSIYFGNVICADLNNLNRLWAQSRLIGIENKKLELVSGKQTDGFDN